MAKSPTVQIPLADDPADAAMQHSPWRKPRRLSSLAARTDEFLASAGFDRGPWLAVAFAAGIAAWFVLGTPLEWGTAIASAIGLTVLAGILRSHSENLPNLRLAVISLGLVFAWGLSTVWSKSELAGAEPLARPLVGTFDARVLERIEQPAEGRTRLVIATREPASGKAIKVRINVPLAIDNQAADIGARIRIRARLMPPAPPMLPGAYDFARAAWFQGLAGTGSALGVAEIIEPPRDAGGSLDRIQRDLADHVRSRLDGSAGTIAAAFASGDRGAIQVADDEAMRDAGLSHLLSISGLHVSALVAAAYVLAMRLLALWQWLALRVRLPVVAAGIAAGAGIGYTLLTGAEVPTIRSCIGAVLVLLALALGREPLSLRMVAVAAFAVLLVWPEALVGPSFQMSFAAVIAIVALHGCAPVRAFLAPREESWAARGSRRVAMLLATGLVIELALMPIVLFHFHRAGVYGAFANVIAIPLTTFVSMPLIALALLLDVAGAGGPVWWLAGKSLDLLIALAHWTAAQPGAVKLMPQMSGLTFALFLAGGFWIGLWRGAGRLLGLAPAAMATAMLLATPGPDLLVTGDGRHVGIAGEGDRLIMLRETRSDFTADSLRELAGVEGAMESIEGWPGADCSPEFCVATLKRGGRDWHILLARTRARVAERDLAAACEMADIVIADRSLPRSCRPRWLKADMRMLKQTGGLAIDLSRQTYRSVSDGQGDHGWWRAGKDERNSVHPKVEPVH